MVFAGKQRRRERRWTPGARGIRSSWLGAPARVVGCALLVWSLLSSSTAAAQVNLSQFKPVPGPQGLIGIQTARPLEHLGLYGSLITHYTNDEVVYFLQDGTVQRPVRHRTTMEVGLTFSVFERVDLAAMLPVIFHQVSGSYSGSPDVKRDSGLGDLRLATRVILLRNRCQGGIGVAPLIQATLPTTNGGAFMGNELVVFSPGVVVDYCHESGLLIALNAGYSFRPEEKVAWMVFDDTIDLGLGVEIPLAFEGLSLIGEIAAGFNIGQDEEDTDLFHKVKIPVDVLGGIRWRVPGGLAVVLGVGSDITSGFGSPDIRAMVGIGFALKGSEVVRSSGGDRTASRRGPERPRQVARGPERSSPGSGRSSPGPERLSPGARPAPASVPSAGAEPPASSLASAKKVEEMAVLDAESFDRAVADDPDPDGDGIPQSRDRCPTEPEDYDDFEDRDGCPEPDNDKDGIPDSADKCPLQPETINGVEDDDGCPDKGKKKVRLAAKLIKLDERVFFEAGRDRIKTESFSILRQVASTLKANWHVRLVRIAGHTDDRGDREMNVDLSERRARQVKAFLVEQGVAAHRLQAKGYGPTQPMTTNRTREGRAINRRVVFEILIQEVSEVPGSQPASRPATSEQTQGRPKRRGAGVDQKGRDR